MRERSAVLKRIRAKLTKEKIIYIISVALCIIILLAGYLLATGGKSFYAPPDGSIYLRAKVIEVTEEISDYDEDGLLLSKDTVFRAKLIGSDRDGEIVEAYQNYSSYTPFNPRTVKVGDSVIVASFEGVANWNFIDFVRSDALIILSLLFAVLLVIFGRKKGLKTVLSLALTVMAVAFVFIPAVLMGGNVYFWSVAVCIYIIVMTMAITSGISPMSFASAAGCSAGVLLSLLITVITDLFINITGNATPNAIYLVYIGKGIDVRALIYASIIIGCVGAVMDVAVDIAASLKELAAKLQSPTMRELFTSGLNIGRDVIGTMSNTLVLAYIGGSMCSLLLYFYNNFANAIYLFNIEIIVVEILQILVGSIGILLTLPITALISAWLYTRKSMRSYILGEAKSGPRKNVKKKVNADEFSETLKMAGEFRSLKKENDDETS